MINQLQRIKDLVSKSKIEAALDALMELSNQIYDKQLKNEIILNCRNYKKSYRENLLNLRENNVAETKAVMLILVFVDEIEQLYQKDKSIYQPSKLPIINFISKVGILNISFFFIIVVFTIFVNNWSMFLSKKETLNQLLPNTNKNNNVYANIDSNVKINIKNPTINYSKKSGVKKK